MTTLTVLTRLSIALILGGAIGYEREYRNRPAGFRTHMLVSLGAASVSLLQISMLEEAGRLIAQNPALAEAVKIDIGRLGAAVISGIGFLGAGTIFLTRNYIKGLTTAASLWLVAVAGLSVGMGYYAVGIGTSLLALTVLLALGRLQEVMFKKTGVITIEISYDGNQSTLSAIEAYLSRIGAKVLDLEHLESRTEGTGTCLFTLDLRASADKDAFIQEIMDNKGVFSSRIIKGYESQ
ncbi:MAG: MgtC/SapB family protein [Youngiibacter sp.]|nr:MgtC/SapB family protein [Youngiibacter sp.]